VARIRTIKPSFWGDDAVNRLSWDARLLLIGIISLADDDGRFIASQSSICGYIFPHEDVSPGRFKKLMNEVTGTGIVLLYRANGRQYGHLPKWKKHQKISKAQRSPLPEPPQEGLFE